MAFIKGIGKQNDWFVIILDSKKIFSMSELAQVQDATTVGTGQ